MLGIISFVVVDRSRVDIAGVAVAVVVVGIVSSTFWEEYQTMWKYATLGFEGTLVLADDGTVVVVVVVAVDNDCRMMIRRIVQYWAVVVVVVVVDDYAILLPWYCNYCGSCALPLNCHCYSCCHSPQKKQ